MITFGWDRSWRTFAWLITPADHETRTFAFLFNQQLLTNADG